jgi:hypothetical protein
MHFTRLTESEEYRRQRQQLRIADLELLSPVWHLLDLTPIVRGDWFPPLHY